MAKYLPLFVVLLAGVFAGAGMTVGKTSWAGRQKKAAAEKEPFDEARLFFEFNSTDNDLGVQLFLDGEAWKQLSLIAPNGRKILDIRVQGRLGQLGLTELFWESDEPSPEEVLELIQEGEYKFVGRTIEGEVLQSKAELSHELPPAPTIEVPSIPGETLDPDNAIIRWEEIPGIESIEVIVENEDVGAEMLVPLSAGATSLHVPREFLDPETEYKVEVIAIGENGNKTISEREFVTGS
jgi:hypothetical protein